MTSLVTEHGILHYEAYGRGRPVLLLHGWLGSWQLWRDTIETLGKEFRTYALDFYGFGESGTTDRDAYSVNTYVEMVYQFMEQLGIAKAPLIGHSMGGTVALYTAILHPEKVVKVCVIGSPINGASLSLLLKLSGYPTVARLFWLSPFLLKVFLGSYSYLLAKDGRRMASMMRKDISQANMTSFFRSIGTLRQTDLRPYLAQVQVPTLGIYGKQDIIVNPRQNEVLKKGVVGSEISWYPDAGHFPMLDAPQRFNENLRSFLYGKQVTTP